ncbi:MAG: PD-(D/E)XK nuclease family protein [Acidobacteriota bacterium]|nr:PD-(D/E)XK nuclease family protein [Acidobacteriota bacterium]
MRADRGRYRGRRLNEYLGMIGAARWTPGQVTPTDLEEIATCPFRFFLRGVLKIRPPIDAAPLAPDAREMGSLAHRVLEDFFRPREDRRPDEPWPQRLTRWIRIRLQELKRGAVDASGPLWNASARRLERELLGFLLGELAMLSGRDVRVAGTEEEYVGELEVADAVVRIVGRPDRVDRDTAGNVEIVDYKWSKGQHYPSSGKGLFAGGRCLQLPLYAWLLTHREEIPRVQRVRYAFLRGAQKNIVIERQALVERKQELVTVVGKVLDFARRGELPPMPKGGENCRYCDYRRICGPGVARIGEQIAEDPVCRRHRQLAQDHP